MVDPNEEVATLEDVFGKAAAGIIDRIEAGDVTAFAMVDVGRADSGVSSFIKDEAAARGLVFGMAQVARQIIQDWRLDIPPAQGSV